MRTIIALTVAACSASPGPHDRGDCDEPIRLLNGQPAEFHDCERACSKEPITEPVTCTFTCMDGYSATAFETFVALGVRGVCIPRNVTSVSRQMLFCECDQQ